MTMFCEDTTLRSLRNAMRMQKNEYIPEEGASSVWARAGGGGVRQG